MFLTWTQVDTWRSSSFTLTVLEYSIIGMPTTYSSDGGSFGALQFFQQGCEEDSSIHLLGHTDKGFLRSGIAESNDMHSEFY